MKKQTTPFTRFSCSTYPPMAPPPITSRTFKVHRREPELITPAKPTPNEVMPLSDIDDQETLRFQIPVIQIYRHNTSMQGKDPVKVIKEAVAKTLVFYYPFAGRLREGPNRKLIVDCTGEGILFMEADADASLEQFGDAIRPPFPCLDELLFDVPGSSGILHCPLFLIQVTRFKCGGFTFALRLNHTMCDAFGLFLFMSAIGEMAGGEHVPSVLPTWQRHVFNARNPPQVTFAHPEYEKDANNQFPLPFDDLIEGAIFIGSSELLALRRFVPPHLRDSSTFEVLTACLWKYRTIALQPNPKQEMRMICLNNVRRKFNPPLLPEGYYGNGFALSTAVATAEELCKNSVGYALELIRNVTRNMPREYLQSVADLMVIKGRPSLVMEGTYIMSDLRNARFREVDFGWGKATYGGPARARPLIASFCMPFENGIVLPICLPAKAMERFVKEIQNLLQAPIDDSVVRSVVKMSAL